MARLGLGAATAACALVFLLIQVSEIHAANASEPHPHQGSIPRLKMDGKPDVKLTAADLKQIESGDLWHKVTDAANFGSGIGVRDIAAPLDIVWEEITNLEAYVGKVPKLQSLKIYSREKGGAEEVSKATYFVKVFPGYSLEYFVEHQANRKQAQLMFSLDYDRHSDIDDLQGKWYLEPHPSKKGWTRIYYQCDIKLFGYTPKLIKNIMAGQGIVTTTTWVKVESEKRAPKLAPSSAAFVSLAGRSFSGALADPSSNGRAVRALQRSAVAQTAPPVLGGVFPSSQVAAGIAVALASMVLGVASRARPRGSKRRVALHRDVVRIR